MATDERLNPPQRAANPLPTPEQKLADKQAANPPPTPEQVEDEIVGSTVHTYPDGSQVVGRPPFPDKSPLERQAQGSGLITPPPPMPITQGRPQSGTPEAAAPTGITAEQLAEKASQQLTSDVVSGKDPHTPNPTTSSDKPQLAGTSGIVTADQLEPTHDLTKDEIKAIAAGIKPEGSIEATDEEKQAAVVQVARETKGPIATDAGAGAKPAGSSTVTAPDVAPAASPPWHAGDAAAAKPGDKSTKK